MCFESILVLVEETYKHLRGRHADAINILKTEFEYTPCFKRGGNVKPYHISGGIHNRLYIDSLHIPRIVVRH